MESVTKTGSGGEEEKAQVQSQDRPKSKSQLFHLDLGQLSPWSLSFFIYKTETITPTSESGCCKQSAAAAAAAKLLQSCPTLCNPIDGSPPGSPISGILQAKTVEWVAISFSNA